MKPHYAGTGATIYAGDCLEVMAELEAESVTAIVTDPPYGLGFMGKAWDHGVPGVPFWEAALRVAKPGAHLLAFGGTRTHHRLMCAIEDAGWEIRDCMMWLYGSGFPKSLDVSKAIDKAAGAEREVVGMSAHKPGIANETAGHHTVGGTVAKRVPITAPATDAAREWDGYGTALKPAWEPIIMARKPLVGTVAQNVQAHGAGALNVDGCRIPSGDKVGASGRWGMNSDRGWNGNSVPNKTQTTYEHTNGRWPANVALDEEAAALLDAQSGESSSVPNERRNSAFKSVAKGHETAHSTRGHNDSGGASRFFFTSKAGRSDRNGANDHPTVKPNDLMRWLVRLVSSPSGTVILDPFMGSGSTIVAARDEHVEAIGIELDEHNCEIARRRLAQGTLAFE